MDKIKKEKIEVKGVEIEVYTEDYMNDYISLTDIAKYKNAEEPNVVVANWMRNFNTIEYLGIWERLNNPKFNPLEFEGYLKKAGSNAFTLSPQKWQKTTNAIGIVVRLEEMVERSRTKTLLLSLLPGYQPNLNCTLLKIIKD